MYARLQDLTALAGRIGVGLVFLVHGLQKWDNGVAQTSDAFGAMGVPLPTVAAIFTIAVEVAGSVAFIAGVALPVVGIGFAVVGIGATFTAHAGNGLLGPGAYDLVLVLALAGLGLGFNGGRLSVDRAIGDYRRARAQEQEEAQAG